MNLDVYVRCFDSLMSRGPSRGPNNVYVYMNHIRTKSKVVAMENGFNLPPPPPSNLLLTVPRQCASIVVTLIANFRPLSVCLWLTVQFITIAFWPIVGKELSPWLFPCAVLIKCHLNLFIYYFFLFCFVLFYFSAGLIVGFPFPFGV